MKTAEGVSYNDVRSVRVESDLEFIRALGERAGDSFRACLQCGNCSATCTISPILEPYPRKEMAWAKWGMKDNLLADPDVWLCHQCNDCSTRCPCGARPGDVLAAIRHESVIHHAFPRFLSTWVNEPKYVPLLVGLPAALLGLAILLRDRIDSVLGMSARAGDRIVYSYTSEIPQWLVNGFFTILAALVVVAVVAGVVRYWRFMKNAVARDGPVVPAKGLYASTVSVLRSVLTHDKFSECTTARARYVFHLYIFFGFIALALVSFWTVAAPYNPLIKEEFVYPFNFWNPWKILGNLGGLALGLGCFLTLRDRLIAKPYTNPTTYFEWAFLLTMFGAVVSGFLTEAAHYLRLEPHRHVIYFIHLVLVFVLLMSLPFSKFSHVLYRTTAMVFAEYTGRDTRASAGGGRVTEDAREEEVRVEET